MTDVSQGTGWWLASDGRWYPPHLHPRHRPASPYEPTWWLASDGRWYPPETHPSLQLASAMAVPIEFGYDGSASTPHGQSVRRRAARRRGLTFAPALMQAIGRWASLLRVGYAMLAVLVAAYVVSVIVRGDHMHSTLVDGWGVDGLELFGSLLCLSRVAVRSPGRGVALSLGLGIFAWGLGDTLVTVRGTSTPPLGADVSYLAFYPLAYVAILLLMRREIPHVSALRWLDGAVASLGAAAVLAAFAFHDIQHTVGGNPLTTAMNLAYPVGDILLFALVVGVSAMLSGKNRSTWFIVALALALNAVGDTFNLFHRTVGSSSVGQLFNAVAWPVAILLLSMSVWLRFEEPERPHRELPAGFTLPVLAAAAGLVILTVRSVYSIGEIALGLAVATLAVAGVRMTLSVGALRTMTEQRRRQSITDELTGLGNRRHLSDVFDVYANGGVITGTLAVLFVDLDGFKEVNDTFGHSAGDELLRQIGPRLAAALRDTDVLVRLGGDEFAVLLPDTDAEAAKGVAHRLVANLTKPFTLDVLPIQISASIGIAVAPKDATDLTTLLRCADAAMYRAKLARSPFEVYDGTVDGGGDLLELMEELRVALDKGQLVLHFQPQLDLRTGSVATVEALVRWNHPRLGLIPPLKFLPLAEEAGLMPALTARVLDDALAQCAAWRAEGQDITVAVNISPNTLLAPGFIDLVSRTLDRHRLPAHALVLEITETCIVSDYERTRAVVDQLRRIGVVTSIDDFGAGFTSLAHLANLAVAELKLDRAFVADLASDAQVRDVELVRSTIALGHALGLRVVAEGIETQETLNMLVSFECDLAQGYLISKPAPADALQLGTLGSTWGSRPLVPAMRVERASSLAPAST